MEEAQVDAAAPESAEAVELVAETPVEAVEEVAETAATPVEAVEQVAETTETPVEAVEEVEAAAQSGQRRSLISIRISQRPPRNGRLFCVSAWGR